MATMADSGDHKKRSILKLALLVGFGDSSDACKPPAASSPRSFAAGDGAVGLAIVAAMSAAEEPARSEPIPIATVVTKPTVRAAPALNKGEEERAGDMELSESYTCVISHLGGNRVKKRVYFGDGEGGLLLEPPLPPSPPPELAEPPPPFVVADFLRCCFLCKKQLDGMDVYMYRGEKAFCSEECRYQQMLLDEFSETFGSGAMKNYERSSSTCSASLHITAGVAVA